MQQLLAGLRSRSVDSSKMGAKVESLNNNKWGTMRKLSHLIAGITAATVVSCGGGGSSPPPNPIQGVSPGGIWRGTDSASGLAIIGLVDETGDGDFIRADYAQFVGQVSTSDNSIAAAAQGYADSGKTFPDGSTHGTWNMDGMIQERQSINATTAFTTDNGTATHGTFDLTFDALYNRPSSLETVAGDFAPVNSLGFIIGSDGSIFGTGAGLPCHTMAKFPS